MNRLAATTAIALALVLSANLSLAATELRAMVKPSWDDERVLTILVIGSDMGLPRVGNPLSGRADGLHLIAVDTKRARATIVDIPRDSFIAGDKVNAHLSFGGPERLKRVMSSYTGINIDYYALTTFRGLRSMVDAMNGVPIELDFAIRDPAAKANLKKGKQRLSGQEALQFSRARKSIPGGDFRRSNHQGKLMRAAHRRLRQDHSSLMSMTRMLGSFSRNTTTDIPKRELFRLASLALKVKPSSVKQVPLSGPAGFAGAQSIVHLQPGSAFRDIKRLRIGR